MNAQDVALMMENREAKKLDFRLTFEEVQQVVLNLIKYHGKLYKGHPLVMYF